MGWRDLISDLYITQKNAPGLMAKPAFQPPASTQQIADMESKLGTTVQADLRSLILETNGVMSLLKIDDDDWFENQWLLWPISEIIEQNLYFRGERAGSDSERRFGNLFFFANAGSDGILFAHPVNMTAIADPGVVAWFPIEDEVVPVAANLGDFLERWMVGELFV